jgi:hypothetical protein
LTIVSIMVTPQSSLIEGDDPGLDG